jgi:hypothetical protein
MCGTNFEKLIVLIECSERICMRVILTVFIVPCLFGQTASADESGPVSTAARTVEAKSIADEPLDTVPADTVPGDTVPGDTVPADTVPADTVPADAARITTAEDPPVSAGTRRALLVCGHPGNAEYARIYTEVFRGLRKGLVEHWHFPDDEILVLSGTQDAGLAHGGRHGGPATRERIRAAVDELAQRLSPSDTLWVIVVGHAHFDGRRALFNLSGPDLDMDGFGEWFRGVGCREQVFFITTALSGYAIRSLSRNGRVILTATEADQAVNETIYPIMLALTLSEPPALDELDQDRDGRLTLLDLHVTVSRRVLEAYAQSGNIPTEHAQLDDNGDGRGTEVQWDYLDQSLGGRLARGPRPRIPAGADGAWAATIQFNLTHPPVSPDAAPDDR